MKKYFIILQGFFDIAKSLPLQKFLSVPNNKVSSKKIYQKSHNCTESKFNLQNKSLTRKAKPLFRMKDTCLHPPRKIYYGVCSCRETYITSITSIV